MVEGANERLVRRWALVAGHRERLLRVVRTRTASDADAEDIVHEAMVRTVLFDGLDEDRAGQFLTTVAMRLCADAHRRSGRMDRLVERLGTHAVDEVSPEEAVCDAAEARAVAAVYETLPSRQRSVVAARSEGMSCGQVAGRLGLTYGAVESALVRARAAVRARVDICLEATTLCAGRAWRSLRAVPAELPAASAVALGTLLATAGATAPPARPPVVRAAGPERELGPAVVVPAPAPRATVTDHPAPRAVPAAVAPVVVAVGPPLRPREPVFEVPGGGAGADHVPTGRTTPERIQDCVKEGIVLWPLPVACRTPDPGGNP